ncbi:MAG: hypothetical protein NTV03_03975 [Candidatus Nomurabacteria bacterium]|nr:hypothetical protein [Candidatus Nomurabacteria bacterium]
MTHIPLILTILSSLIFLGFFVLYNKDILNGSVKPNIVSWGLFSLITLINAVTYIAFTHDIFKGALAFTDFFTCIVITCLIIFRGQLRKLSLSEIIIIILSVASLVVWWLLKSALYANLLLQPAYILAFIPTLKNAWANPQNESSLVWLMWAFSFLLTITVIIIRWDNNFADIINSSIAFILHLSVGLLAGRGKRV